MTQFLLRLPDDIKEAFFQRQIEILQKGERLEKGKILTGWQYKGITFENIVKQVGEERFWQTMKTLGVQREEVEKKAHPNDRS